MANRYEAAEDQMRQEIEAARPCHHCGEPRRAHYAGVLLGCRQGRTIYAVNLRPE